MKVKKLTSPTLWSNKEYENEFIKLMGEVIRASSIDHKLVPQLMYHVYRDELELSFAEDYR